MPLTAIHFFGHLCPNILGVPSIACDHPLLPSPQGCHWPRDWGTAEVLEARVGLGGVEDEQVQDGTIKGEREGVSPGWI